MAGWQGREWKGWTRRTLDDTKTHRLAVDLGNLKVDNVNLALANQIDSAEVDDRRAVRQKGTCKRLRDPRARTVVARADRPYRWYL